MKIKSIQLFYILFTNLIPSLTLNKKVQIVLLHYTNLMLKHQASQTLESALHFELYGIITACIYLQGETWENKYNHLIKLNMHLVLQSVF